MPFRSYGFFDPLAGKVRTFVSLEGARDGADRLCADALRLHGLALHIRIWRRIGLSKPFTLFKVWNDVGTVTLNALGGRVFKR